MGEYAETKAGSRIKIGTCENMYYLRFDQLRLLSLRQPAGCTDLLAGDRIERVRFRFPFPSEDRIAPGDFDNPDLSVGLYGVAVSDQIEHSRIQLKVTGSNKGVMVMVPCPLSPEGKALEASTDGTDHAVKYQFNGYSGDVQIVQQRVWNNYLALVLDCGACGARYRCETLADAQPVIDALNERADREGTGYNADESRAAYWRKVSERITAGYCLDVAEHLAALALPSDLIGA